MINFIKMELFKNDNNKFTGHNKLKHEREKSYQDAINYGIDLK